MDNSEKESVLKEYLQLLSVLRPLKYFGFWRFDVQNGRIVSKSWSSVFYTIITTFAIIISIMYVVYQEYYVNSYLLATEVMTIYNFTIFQTFINLNTCVANKTNGAKFINTAIDIDVSLGAKETKFLRDVASRTYFYLCALVSVLQVSVLVVLYLSYLVELMTYIVGSINFAVLYFIYYDFSFFLTLYTFLTLRIRYLNVAIMKIGHMNPDHLPHQFPFNSLLWERSYNDLVDFHVRAEADKIIDMFRIIFEQVRCLELYYRFTIMMCLLYLPVGTFLTIQTFIDFATSTDMEAMRLVALTGWCVLSWFFQLIMTQQTDMFFRQIEQTYLICTYIQLKPTHPDEVYELTSRIINTLEVRDARISIYGIFYYDTGLLLKLTASMFVYITMQLQLAFNKSGDVHLLAENATKQAL